MERSRCTALAGTILLLITTESSAQENRIFPLRGVVACPGRPGLHIRRAPPEVTTFSYNLTDPICGVGNGSEFVALEELYIANGEIWFRVNVTKILKPTGHCPQNLTGWMVAKLKSVGQSLFLNRM
ncbi:MAG TPA: hypothetical protein VF179_30440 [Thermoanaerobaculia bacterium]|nr:hypothetical protein [Thermoanaerobaculia bacterium]